MKIWMLLILLLFVGCSFKKNTNSDQPTIALSDEERFSQKLRTEDEDSMVKYIAETRSAWLTSKNNASKFLKIALVRGNTKIVSALLHAGVSPYMELSTYRGDSSFDPHAFAVVADLNSNIAGQIDSVAGIDNFEAFQTIMKTYSLSCETIVDLALEYRVSRITPQFFDAQLIKFLQRTSSCGNLAQSSLKHEWMTKEIFRLYTETNHLQKPEFFIYLSHLFAPIELKFKSGLVIPAKQVTPQALVMYKIKQIDSLDTQDRLIKIWIDTLNVINYSTSPEGISFQEDFFYFGTSKLDSQNDVDKYFKFNVINSLEIPQISDRPNCFIFCDLKI